MFNYTFDWITQNYSWLELNPTPRLSLYYLRRSDHLPRLKTPFSNKGGQNPSNNTWSHPRWDSDYTDHPRWAQFLKIISSRAIQVITVRKIYFINYNYIYYINGGVRHFVDAPAFPQETPRSWRERIASAAIAAPETQTWSDCGGNFPTFQRRPLTTH